MATERAHEMALSDELREVILDVQRECTIIWNTKDGNSTGTLVSFVWHKGSVWILGNESQARVKAFLRNPNATVVVSSVGTDVGRERCISMRGQCRIHDDKATANEVVSVFVDKLNVTRSNQAAEVLTGMCTGPGSVWLEIVPETRVTMDMHEQMWQILAN